jgi:hypothetical protein
MQFHVDSALERLQDTCTFDARLRNAALEFAALTVYNNHAARMALKARGVSNIKFGRQCDCDCSCDATIIERI